MRALVLASFVVVAVASAQIPVYPSPLASALSTSRADLLTHIAKTEEIFALAPPNSVGAYLRDSAYRKAAMFALFNTSGLNENIANATDTGFELIFQGTGCTHAPCAPYASAASGALGGPLKGLDYNMWLRDSGAQMHYLVAAGVTDGSPALVRVISALLREHARFTVRRCLLLVLLVLLVLLLLLLVLVVPVLPVLPVLLLLLLVLILVRSCWTPTPTATTPCRSWTPRAPREPYRGLWGVAGLPTRATTSRTAGRGRCCWRTRCGRATRQMRKVRRSCLTSRSSWRWRRCWCSSSWSRTTSTRLIATCRWTAASAFTWRAKRTRSACPPGFRAMFATW